VSTLDSAGRRMLTVELGLQGGEIERKLHADHLHEPSLGPRLDEVGATYVVGQQRGIAALRGMLDAGDPEAPGLGGPDLARAGEALFELLFGVTRDGEPAFLHRLFGEETATPTRHPVRLRIVTRSEELLGLPWGISAWRGSLLRDYGWTFEVSDLLAPTEMLRLKAPTSILLILPQLGRAEGDLRSNDHHEDLAEAVDTYFRGQSRSPDRFAVAVTRAEVIQKLTEVKPSLVYYYGHGVARPDPGLVVPSRRDDPASAQDSWSARDVALAIRRSGAPVLVAYLNGCMTGAGGWSGVGRQLLEAVPVVLAHPTKTWAFSAARAAVRWFRLVLGEQVDPVGAAYHREAHDPTTGVGWLPLQAHTRHLGFRVDLDQADFRRPVTGMDLDRRLQRDLANTQVRELSVRRERRVQGFVALGTPHNHAADVARQLHQLVEDLDPRLDLHLSDPVDVARSLVHGAARKPGFLPDMAERLGAALERDGEMTLRDALESSAPPRTPRRHRILWLDWGVLRTLPVVDDVAGWMDFCAAHLVPALPPGVDAVVTVALEIPADKLARVQEKLDDLVNHPTHRTDQIRFTVLPPLGPAPLGEILQFLDDAHCPQGLRDDLAKLLRDDTAGDYARMRRQIDRGLAGGWFDLARELRGTAGKVAPDEDV
jgi:hypothetical protein